MDKYIVLEEKKGNISKIYSFERGQCIFKHFSGIGAQNEFDICRQVHQELECPFLMNPIEVLDQKDQEKDQEEKILVMPQYGSFNLAEWTCRREIPLPVECIDQVASAAICALFAFHCQGLCFADMKPDHIQPHEQNRFVVIDVGSVVPIGGFLSSCIDRYKMNEREIPSERFDLTCLATTLWEFYTGQNVWAFPTIEIFLEQALPILVRECFFAKSVLDLLPFVKMQPNHVNYLRQRCFLFLLQFLDKAIVHRVVDYIL